MAIRLNYDMKQLLLVPSVFIENGFIKPYFPYGLLLLEALSVNSFHYQVDIYMPTEELLTKKFDDSSELVKYFADSIDVEKYDIVGFSTMSSSAHYAIGIAKEIKSLRRDLLIVLGGPYVTKLAHKIIIQYKFIDGIFVGEAEVAFSEFINRKLNIESPFSGIGGIVTHNLQSSENQRTENLDHLPFITDAPSFFVWLSLVREKIDNNLPIPLEASRGCPLQCIFCSTRQTWGAKVRRKSAARIIKEMDRIFNLTSETFFCFVGDNIGRPVLSFMKFCNELKAINKEYHWACSLKLDKINNNHLEAMWNAGCRSFFVGLESASQGTLDKVNKRVNLTDEIRMVKASIDMGFKVDLSFIIGFPWETEDEIKKTYLLHSELLKYGANLSHVNILCPIPGTDIVKDGHITFNGLKSNAIDDGISLSSAHEKMVNECSDLYSYLGHYSAHRLSKGTIKAYSAAAIQISALHTRKRRCNV